MQMVVDVNQLCKKIVDSQHYEKLKQTHAHTGEYSQFIRVDILWLFFIFFI